MDLKPILCGPILRRTEPGRVCIWLATSIQPDNVEAIIYSLKKRPGGWDEDLVITGTTYNVHQLGSRLFIILLEVSQLEGVFSSLTPYGYDLNFTFAQSDLAYINKYKGWTTEPYLLSKLFPRTTLSYFDLPYPTFVIPDTSKPNARILYGSCRKTHGKGSDALNAGDKLLEQEWGTYSKAYVKGYTTRLPDYTLFFLGDQIYADDLHPGVFFWVQDLALSIMGYEEVIPEYVNISDIDFYYFATFLENYEKGVAGYNIEDVNLLTRVSYKSHTVTANRRENIVTCLQQYFSTNYEIWYLMKAARVSAGPIADIYNAYSEFINGRKSVRDLLRIILQYAGNSNSKIDLNEILPRPYLLSALTTQLVKTRSITYGNRRDFVRLNCAISTDDKGHLLSFGEFAALYLLNWGAYEIFPSDPSHSIPPGGFDPKEENLEGLIKKNQRVRRLLANVPSYMIFDDHEVTDEWNADEVWRKRIEGSATGKRIMTNALAAYWAFQAWGNIPDQFPAGFISAITDHLKNPLYNKGVDDQSKASNFESTLLNFQDWAFIAPTNPVSIFLDSRTLREKEEDMSYNAGINYNRKFKAPRLMSSVAFKKLETLLNNSPYIPNSPVIFCAATPVLGSPLFEQGQLEFINGDFNKNYTAVTKSRFQEPGRYKQDYENWRANPLGKYDLFYFIDSIVKPSNIILLSGDVHYAFHTYAYLYSYITKKMYEIDQFTSSALKNNTLDKLDKINQLAYVSLIDTKDEVYKKVIEEYPDPFNASTNHFKVMGHLVQYSEISDPDTWIIFQNNLGLLNLYERNQKLFRHNIFLYSKNFDSPVIKSIRL